MRKSLDEESIGGVAGAGEKVVEVSFNGPGEGGEGKRVGGAKGASGVGVSSEKFIPKGSSITLWGSGDRSGRDVNNAMGLSEMYQVILGV